MRNTKIKKVQELAVVHDHACGIDVGSTFHMVAIGMESTDIKRFGVYTEDHKKLVGWLQQKGIKHIPYIFHTAFYMSFFIASARITKPIVKLIIGG